MIKSLRILSLVALFATAACTADAQKFGHINSADLLAALPEVKAADTTLAQYQRSLEGQYNDMVGEYSSKVTKFQNDKTMNDAVREVKQQELQDLQTRIQTFQESAQEKLQGKKQELYTPILKKAEDAVKAVAKENSYAYVFDTSVGAVIYAQESDDITPLVKKKLNLK
jgi:outer membrane protein